MVEKFNFYDIYGYLLPGIVLVALLWLPFGLFLHIWPKELSAALIVVVLSYAIGHLTQNLSGRVLPSSTTDRFGDERFPSDLILDGNTFTPETKNKIDQLSQKYFNLKLEPQDNPQQRSEHQGVISRSRKDAFFQARSLLLKDKKTSYWEQFEGLYALMRSVSTTCAASAAYFFGWGIGFSHKDGLTSGFSQTDGWVNWSAGLFLFFVIITIPSCLQKTGTEKIAADAKTKTKDKKKKFVPIALGVSLFFVACFAGMLLSLSWKNLPPSGPFIMLVLALTAAIASIRCYVAYTSFAWLFAEHVWRDFANIEKPEPPTTFSQAFPNS